MPSETTVAIVSDADIIDARKQGRAMALELGFSSTDMVLITTAISELARNIVLYARRGEIVVRRAIDGERVGIVVEARDDGPGIPDVEKAMQSGYSTSGNLGLGLPGVRRLMDEMDVRTRVGEGTIVVARKWKR